MPCSIGARRGGGAPQYAHGLQTLRRASLRSSSSQHQQRANPSMMVHLLLLAFIAAGSVLVQPASAATPPDAPPHTHTHTHTLAAPASAVSVTYCPDGRALEAGLCYARCPLGSYGFGCTCWSRHRAPSWRGCGTLPRQCAARSFRRPLPPAGPRSAPFSLVLSADPQLFRNYTRYSDRAGAEAINRRLVRAINRVRDLRAWPRGAGGGRVAEPAALAVLGDLTEFGTEAQADAFRHFYDPAYPRRRAGDGGGGEEQQQGEVASKAEAEAEAKAAAGGQQGGGGGVGDGDEGGDDGDGGGSDLVRFPTWLMLGNHDYVNNARRCAGKGGYDRSFCARWAVASMRAALAPECAAGHWAGLPKANVTAFDAGSMAYAFDYGSYHFIALHHSPRHRDPELGIEPSMAWLAAELARAAAHGRRAVLLLHAHKELRLAYDPTFAALVEAGPVAAIFAGHVHIRPWGLVGRYPNTSVPVFNCGASWYNVYCLAEFDDDGFRVGAVAHYGDARPEWFGTSLHSLPRGHRGKPVLEAFAANPNTTTWWRPDRASPESVAAAAAAAEAEAAGEEPESGGATLDAVDDGDEGDEHGGGKGGGGGHWRIRSRRLLE